MIPQPTGYDWLANGGAYWLIGLSWLLSAAFFSVVGVRAANASNAQNDGCLMIICSTLLAFTGGGIGLYAGVWLTHYPTFVITSILAAVLLPAFGSVFLIPKLKKNR